MEDSIKESQVLLTRENDTGETSRGSSDVTRGKSDPFAHEAVEIDEPDGEKGDSGDAINAPRKLSWAEKKSLARQDSWIWKQLLVEQEDPNEVSDDHKKRKESLLKVIKEEEYHKVEAELTAKALLNCGGNPLLLAIEITENVHAREDMNKPDKAAFNELANRVEEFALRFLDPLKHNEKQREKFAKSRETDVILNTAIKLQRKKFFDHPIILDLMTERWYGTNDYLKSSRPWWLFLNIWCLIDVVFFPLPFVIAFILGKYKKYKEYFTVPYFIFVRDTLIYLALLGLHFAICFEPSQLPFSNLEWAILVFFLGRLFTEIKQVVDMAKTKSYLRDRWNIFDLVILFIFFCLILPLRVVTWEVSESVTNNRPLQIAGYLYGINAMPLTFRAIGSILETFKGVGTIQIALFHIIRETAVVVLHFVAITLAFSSTITKMLVVEYSVVEGNTTSEHHTCDKTGIPCWWKIFKHLGLSLLELSDGLSFFKSTDSLSEALAHLLFAAYLVMGVILLINMLIALLSNTYQRVQDNSRNEWAFQKAITIQTYSNYHPIPVPFNIISIPTMELYGRLKKAKQRNRAKTLNKEDEFEEIAALEDGADKPDVQLDVKELLHKYRLKYGDSFPPTRKLDQVLDDIEDTRSMVNQVLYRTFKTQQGCDKALLPTGPKAWERNNAILVEDCLLTCEPTLNPSYRYGARYLTAFSPRFPHFEVMILESGETKWMGMGVVFEGYDTDQMPGFWKRSVGYHTDDRRIFDAEYEKKRKFKKTTLTGCAAVRRGDVIRCTVVFEDKQKIGGKVQVPVVFYENGSRVLTRGERPCIEYDPDKPLYPYIAFRYKNSVLFKMCPREDADYQGLELQEVKSGLESKLVQVKSEFAEVKSEIADVHKHLMTTKEDVIRQEMKSDLADIREDLQLQEVKSDFAEMKSDLGDVKLKLDAVLAKLGELEMRK